MRHLKLNEWRYCRNCRSRPIILIWAGVSIFILGLIFSPGLIRAEEGPSLSSAGTVVSEKKENELNTLNKLKRKIDIDYKDADISNILRSLAWTYNLNIVTSPDIKGKVTINLKDVTLEEALDAIVSISGLAYTKKGEVIYISPGDPDMVEMDTKVIFLKYLSASEAQNMLRKLISAKGDIKINEVANSLIITDFPSNIENVEKLLEKVDIPPRQVLIEAKIVDIRSKDLSSLGITWTADYSPGHGVFDRETRSSEQLKASISMPSESTLDTGQITLNPVTFKGLDITVTIDALVKDGKANVLASPSIAVLNGQEARILIGERYPYKERTQTTTGTTETTRFVDIGTNLRVTPQINEDGYITMRIHPEVSTWSGSLDAGPRVDTREADTTVRVKEGETLVIGGLIKQTDSRSREKVPLLGDIPIIGLLFSRRERTIEQKELAVFITPRILRSREEREILGKKKAEAEEVYVSLEKTAGLTIVERIFENAQNLEKGIGVESVRKNKEFRKTQALSLYEHIVAEFPDAERAPEAMYRAGMIYFEDMENYKKAKEVFARLISDYPDSKFAPKARRSYEHIEWIEKMKEK